MTDYIFLKNGKTIKVDIQDREHVKQDLALKSDFWYKGTLVKYFEVKEASIGAAQSLSDVIPELPEGDRKSGFWEKVFILNNERKAIKKPWIFAGAIEWAKQNTSFTNPSTLFDFIDKEWETCEVYNLADKKVPLAYAQETSLLVNAALKANKITRTDIMLAR
jgi:hypothetical protein